MESKPGAPAPPSRSREVGALHGRLALLYLASGMPLSLVTETVPVYLTRAGAALADVGRVPGRAGLAWTLKFLWAPAVDRTGSRRPWIVGAQLAIAAVLAAIALGGSDLGTVGLATLVVALALGSATQDLAADAWTVHRVAPRDLGPANAVRTSAYRIGMAVAGGVLVKVAGGWGWAAAFGVAAGLYVVFAATSLAMSDDPHERPAGPPLLPAVADLVRRPGFAALATFVLLFKVGDYALGAMAKPFQVRTGLSDDEIGNLALVGIAATIVGVALGGVATKRWGLFRALWVLGLLQAGSNLVYALAASSGDRDWVYAAAIVEPACGGLGTAPFVSFLMLLCAKAHAATQFALLTALMGLGRTLASEWAGAAVDRFGFAPYFVATALAALPAYALLPWIREAGPRPTASDPAVSD